MSLISDGLMKKKLNDNKINIKTKYIVGNKILERNTGDSVNDDIVKGIRCEKQYYINSVLKRIEKKFDSRIEYTFVSLNMQGDYTCPNCGANGQLKNFIDGCPYCGTYYNMDYIDKDLGSKYHYDRVLRNTSYRVITGIIDLIISLVLTFVFIKLTSRTFNSYDISKIFIYGFILSLILYYFFYILDAYVVLGPIKRYKDRMNQKQRDFWNRTKIDKQRFFNNLNYEVNKMYANINNVIDYDILDYLEFIDINKNNNLYVKVKADVRIVYYKNNMIKSKYKDEVFVLKKNSDEVLSLNEGVNILKCPNCGASIDAKLGHCEFCHTEIKPLQEWVMDVNQ